MLMLMHTDMPGQQARPTRILCCLVQILDLPDKAVNQATALGNINSMGSNTPGAGSQLR
jgi:hypothetical protein